MGNTQVEALKKQVLETRISADNPGIQKIIENRLRGWVETYLQNKNPSAPRSYDCYGGPGDIPDIIRVADKTYTPPQILEHVERRDGDGKMILEKIVKNYKHQFKRDWGSNVNEVVIQSIDGYGLRDEHLDRKFVMMALTSSGVIEPTWRGILEGFIKATPSIKEGCYFLSVGWQKAIMGLYIRTIPLYDRLPNNLKACFWKGKEYVEKLADKLPVGGSFMNDFIYSKILGLR